MSQLSRATKWSRLIGTAQLNRRLPSTFLISPKLFSTEAAESSLGSSDVPFLQTPTTGPVYGKLGKITKHMTRSDAINFLEGSNLSPERLKVEYDPSYFPISMLIEFPARSSYDAALRALSRKDRLYHLAVADKAEWDAVAPYDGKVIVLHGIPRNALTDDVERYLSGCQYDSSSLKMFYRGKGRMALVRFPSPFITKNSGFCLNNQITLQVLHYFFFYLTGLLWPI